MKNYVYAIICIAMLMCSCSRTTLQRETTKDTLNLDSTSQVKTEKQLTTEEEETVTVKTDSNSYSIQYLFDTNKPVDESTGLPPVKSIFITGNSSKSEKTANKTINTKEQVKKKQSVELKKKSTSTSDITNKTKTTADIIPFIFMILLFIAGIYVIFCDNRTSFFKKIWKG